MSNENQQTSEETENQDSISRRNVLGAVGATAGATVSSRFVRTVSAESVDVSRILDSSPVRKLLEEVGDPQIVNQDTKVYKGGDYTLAVVELKTEIGVLTYHEVLSSESKNINQGDTSVSIEIENVSRATREELPNRIRNIPLGVRLTARYEGGQTSFTSSVTNEEKDQLAEIADAKNFVALYISKDSNFYYVNDMEGGYYRISGDIERPLIENPSTEEIVTSEVDVNECFKCGTKVPYCIPACSHDCNPMSGNALECGKCIYYNCRGVDVKACVKCIASLPEDIIN
jgi:hypothetical protein